MKRQWVILGLWLGIMALVLGVTTRKKLKPSQLEPLWPVPAVDFVGVTTASSGAMNVKDLLGRPWVANFVFTRCGGPCPVMSGKMAALQRTLPPDVKLISFTVDPEFDTPAVLQKYAENFKADPKRWIFARLPKDALYKLVFEGFRLSLADRRKDPPETRVLHSTQFVLVDGHGTIRAFYDSNGPDFFEHLRNDVSRLMEEKA